MWRFIARPLDRFAIRSACGSVRPSPDGAAHAEEAAAFLASSDFFCPRVNAADLQFTGKDAFRFPSAVESPEAGNNTVPGRCELVAEDWRERPAVILLHGWNAELQYQWCLPYWSQLLTRAGINAFRFELPYHASRRPRSPAPIQNFLSGDLLHVTRATHQTLADVRSLALWLRAQGASSVTVWGPSLGAWLAGLAVAHQPELDAAVLLTPVVRMERALCELAFCEPIRGHLAGFHQQFERLNLVAHPPAGDKDILVVASQLDLFAPTETIDELERFWHPEVWRLEHGHISVLLSGRVMRRIVQWVASRAAGFPHSSSQANEREARRS